MDVRRAIPLAHDKAHQEAYRLQVNFINWHDVCATPTVDSLQAAIDAVDKVPTGCLVSRFRCS
eukprot:4841233-Pyramimonas_sp.AAC.2